MSGSRSYNDGAWHQAVATLGASGETLYVDGKKVGYPGGRHRGPALQRVLAARRRQPRRLAEPAGEQRAQRCRSTRSRCTRPCCPRPGSRPTTVPRVLGGRAPAPGRRLRRGGLGREPEPVPPARRDQRQHGGRHHDGRHRCDLHRRHARPGAVPGRPGGQGGHPGRRRHGRGQQPDDRTRRSSARGLVQDHDDDRRQDHRVRQRRRPARAATTTATSTCTTAGSCGSASGPARRPRSTRRPPTTTAPGTTSSPRRARRACSCTSTAPWWAPEPRRTPQDYTGYWRIGGDNTWGGASTNDFAGSLDEVAVYPAVLSAATVQAHYHLGVSGGEQAADGVVHGDADGPGGGVRRVGVRRRRTGPWRRTRGTSVTASTGTGSSRATRTGSGHVHGEADGDRRQGRDGHGDEVGDGDGPPANKPPTASFTSTATDLAVAFDGVGVRRRRRDRGVVRVGLR